MPAYHAARGLDAKIGVKKRQAALDKAASQQLSPKVTTGLEAENERAVSSDTRGNSSCRGE